MPLWLDLLFLLGLLPRASPLHLQALERNDKYWTKMGRQIFNSELSDRVNAANLYYRDDKNTDEAGLSDTMENLSKENFVNGNSVIRELNKSKRAKRLTIYFDVLEEKNRRAKGRNLYSFKDEDDGENVATVAANGVEKEHFKDEPNDVATTEKENKEDGSKDEIEKANESVEPENVVTTDKGETTDEFEKPQEVGTTVKSEPPEEVQTVATEVVEDIVTTTVTTDPSQAQSEVEWVQIIMPQDISEFIENLTNIFSNAGDYLLSIILGNFKQDILVADLLNKFDAMLQKLGKELNGDMKKALKILIDRLEKLFDNTYETILVKLLKELHDKYMS